MMYWSKDHDSDINLYSFADFEYVIFQKTSKSAHNHSMGMNGKSVNDVILIQYYGQITISYLLNICHCS